MNPDDRSLVTLVLPDMSPNQLGLGPRANLKTHIHFMPVHEITTSLLTWHCVHHCSRLRSPDDCTSRHARHIMLDKAVGTKHGLLHLLRHL